MGHDRTTTVEIRADLLEELREIFPGGSDREIVEGIVREYLVRLEEAEHRALEVFTAAQGTRPDPAPDAGRT
jgi:hypothetical protein